MTSAAPLPSSAPALASPARILVVGAGGRENSLGWALSRCPGVEAVWIAPGNGGSPDLAGCRTLAIAESDQEGLLAACREHGVELVVVGPEAPLAAGLADTLRAAGLAVFGPGADGARLESSKQWAKQLMAEAGIPTAGHWPASSREGRTAQATKGSGNRPTANSAAMAAASGRPRPMPPSASATITPNQPASAIARQRSGAWPGSRPRWARTRGRVE